MTNFAFGVKGREYLQLVNLTAEPNLPGMKYCSLAK